MDPEEPITEEEETLRPTDEMDAGIAEKSEEYDASNAAMADPANPMAVEPVEPIKRPPAPEDFDARVTTTHDVHGGGNPRLVMSFDDSIDLDIEARGDEAVTDMGGAQIPREFPLVPGVTTIGSDPDNDICLPGLEAHHAEVRRDEVDEYNLVDLTEGETTIDGGRIAEGIPLRTGRKVDLRQWSLVYQRAEYADHGSPFGGHTGGEFVGHPLAQDVPRPRGTSASGGSEPTATDPGEYY